MGWANCGEDSKGRPIGYAHRATCDQPGCKAKIDRGLSYACGGMHGELDWSCEKYFCPTHLSASLLVDGDVQSVCADCYDEAKKYAADHPDDANELAGFFEDYEGPEWAETLKTRAAGE